MSWFHLGQWSPYAVGAGIGVLSWLAFLLSDAALGCSTPFTRASGALEGILRGRERVRARPYYQRFTPTLGWDGMLVIGIVIGAFLSAVLSGQFSLVWVPSLWAASFGSDALGRWLVALLGGVLMGIGSRWANGCTSGHGISGTLQLSVGSWLATICFFVGGILVAHWIYG